MLGQLSKYQMIAPPKSTEINILFAFLPGHFHSLIHYPIEPIIISKNLMMRKQVITPSIAILLALLISFTSKAQSVDPHDTVNVYDQLFEASAVDSLPSFTGGQATLTDYLNEHLTYPDQARTFGLEGEVVVMFVVTENGSITLPRILQSLDPDCDAEVLRAIEKMPPWTPAVVDGTQVASCITLNIIFRLIM